MLAFGAVQDPNYRPGATGNTTVFYRKALKGHRTHMLFVDGGCPGACLWERGSMGGTFVVPRG